MKRNTTSALKIKLAHTLLLIREKYQIPCVEKMTSVKMPDKKRKRDMKMKNAESKRKSPNLSS